MHVYVPDKSPFPMPSAPAYKGIFFKCHSISSKTSSTSYTVMQPSNSYHFEPPYRITPPHKSLPYPSTPPNQKPLTTLSTPLPNPKAHIPYSATSPPYQKSQTYPAISPYQNPLPYPSTPPNKNQLVQVHFLHEAKNNYLILLHFPQTSTHYLIKLHLLQIKSSSHPNATTYNATISYQMTPPRPAELYCPTMPCPNVYNPMLSFPKQHPVVTTYPLTQLLKPVKGSFMSYTADSKSSQHGTTVSKLTSNTSIATSGSSISLPQLLSTFNAHNIQEQLTSYPL